MRADETQVTTVGGLARSRDGTRIGYTLYRRDGTTRRTVLIHSLAMDRHFWAPVAESLVAHSSVLILDCRGHGRSDKPVGPYTFELMADDVCDLMDTIGWESALIAGASMGGCITLAFAKAYPRQTKALGLFDTTAWYGPDAPAQWGELAKRGVDKGLESLIDFQKTRWFTDAFREQHPEIVQQCVDTFLANDPQAYAATCTMLGACNLSEAIKTFRMPASIVVGREDYATPVAMSEALHQSLRNSTLTIIEDGRHLTPLEHPDRITDELIQLLDRS